MDGSWWRILTKCGPLEKGMANHFSILALRTPWTVWKGKKMRHWKMNSPGWQVPNMLLEISGEITPERIKTQRQKQKHPVVDVTGDGSKVWCYKEPYCIGTWNLGPWINTIWKWSNRRLEKAMESHSSSLAWKIPGVEKPGRLQSMESHRVGHNWSNLAAAAENRRWQEWTTTFKESAH